MSANAVLGHGALIAMELDPAGAPGVFTTVAELSEEITDVTLMRNEVDVTAHNDTIDHWKLSSILRREPFSFGLGFKYDNNTHDHLTGLKHKLLNNTLTGFRLRGPSGTTDTDETIMSGYVQSMSRTFPLDAGKLGANVTIRMTGPWKVDGVDQT